MYAVAYEISPHKLKNKCYVKSSGTIIETRDKNNMRYRVK